MRVLRSILRRIRSDQAGRTLLEVVIASGLMVVVGLVASDLQMTAIRWERRDQQDAALISSLRTVQTYLEQDSQVSRNPEYLQCPPLSQDYRLILHQRRDGTDYRVRYWLVGNRLMRSSVVDGHHPPTCEEFLTADARTAVVGLSSFKATAVAGGLRIRVELGATSQGPDPVSRSIVFELVPWLGVMP